MCGICGVFSPGSPVEAPTIRAMNDALTHRGPDDQDVWTDPAAGIGLGHRRLSILDLSPLGRQPMPSACGRYVLSFNGEVYNHLELRKDLPAYPFRSTSDTETMLAAFSAWGLERALERFIGMFAFGLWDRREQRLHLVRDRLGIKPLYYARSGSTWLFGSELKALRAHPGYHPTVNRDALALYFRHNYIPAPYSIYTDAWKVEPGQLITLGAGEPTRTKWWDARTVWQRGLAQPFEGTPEQALDTLEGLLANAVSLRMLSDVPLGAFLSGGIDSSTVVAFMQEQSAQPVRTFCIGFGEKDYNEADHARAVAEHLGTAHTELYITSRDMLDVIPLMPRYWDEPFADPSQIPTYILSRLTRKHVTVSLSGDGGDELFCGYSRYFWMDRWRQVARVPLAVRRVVAQGLKLLPPKAFDVLGTIGPKLQWRLDILGMKEFWEFYRYFVSHLPNPAARVLGSTEPETALTRPGNRITDDRLAQMAFWDVISYLPDDILTKVDRASMGVALEARVPLLDHRLVEFAASLPTALKVRNGQSKWLLRQALYRRVPREIVDRPKMGFGVPIESWLRGELRPWCEDMLASQRIRAQGYLDADWVSGLLTRFLGGQTQWCHQIWDVLMFQAWLDEWKP